MKRIIRCSSIVVLTAFLVAGCGTQPTVGPGGQGPQNAQPTNDNPGGLGPGGGQLGGNVQINFGADSTTLQPGQCANLQWNVRGGFGVRLDGQPVDLTGQKQVCPNTTTTYRLEVDTGGRVEAREVTIQVGGGGGPAPTNKPGGGGGPISTPTVKSGGGSGGGSGPANTPTTSQGYVDIRIYFGGFTSRAGSTNINNINVRVDNIGTTTWSKSDDPSSSGDLEFRCSRSFTVEGKISTSTYDGSVPRNQIDDPGEVYPVIPWWIDKTGVTAYTISCRITKGPTYDLNSSNNSFQVQWG